MANFLTNVSQSSMFGFGLVREKIGTFQHLGKPNVVAFMPRRDISSMKLKCEGGGGGVKVVEGKEKEEDEDLKTLYSNDEQLFDLVIKCEMEKFYMNSLEDRKLNPTRWIELLRWTLGEIFGLRWEYEEDRFDGHPCFAFKNVTQDNDVQATIVVEEKGYTYQVGGELLKHVRFYEIMERKANALKKKMEEEKKRRERKRRRKWRKRRRGLRKRRTGRRRRGITDRVRFSCFRDLVFEFGLFKLMSLDLGGVSVLGDLVFEFGLLIQCL